jgi:ABC-type lipoprotein export system ATPase subunit
MGQPVSQLTEARRSFFRSRHIGYIFQVSSLAGFTAAENVLLNELHRPPTRSRLGQTPAHRESASPIGSITNRETLRRRQRRLRRPRWPIAKLVLADEPTGALDQRNAQQVLELIRNLCREVNASLLLVSHDLDIAHQLPRVLSLSKLNRAGQLSTTDALAMAAV